MEQVSAETKLRLVQMIREENQQNRMKMQSREQMLNYGYVLPKNRKETAAETDGLLLTGLRIRLALAFLFFLAFFFFDYSGMKLGSMNAEKFATVLNQEMGTNAIDFIKNFTYTLSDNH